ncbi:hypothetical protein [Aeromonas phage 4L372D]|uniref:Phage-like element PBSX protein XkdF domain-containing protein n=2 Tax=Plateaulakevirus TaxID=2843436 RepID=A0A5B9NB04_9CAUD|nr:hypothetical protein HWC27_gp127 [Aeromonas phage 4L372D]YP_009846906.1 hypothetical protein HWC28_gp107 [Aeromonas phage 4L372XY]QEG08591.1 hypothetical protein [Aeromonas phage 4L372D]QEG08822.1 hypothetical protein [Aeromonas phage 4L372XY]
MPYSSIKDLPPSTKSLTTKQKQKFMEVFNAMAAEGMKEEDIFPIALKQAKTRTKKTISKATTDSVEKDDKGNLVYRGTKFPGYNKPIRSNRDGKQGMVLAKKGEEIKVVHFGDPSMEDNYSAEANDAYYARHGEESDIFSAKYWSHKWLWPKGKLKGKGPKEFHTLKKSSEPQIIEEMIAYEVVYEPDTKDAHGEWMTQETILKACENFNKNLELGNVKPNLFHFANTDLFSIEKSWIQQEIDVVVEATNQPIKAGTWVVKTKYNDPDLWLLKKAGVIQGVSIGARGSINKETGEITDVTFDPYDEE